jgi:hypothetical protein
VWDWGKAIASCFALADARFKRSAGGNNYGKIWLTDRLDDGTAKEGERER